MFAGVGFDKSTVSLAGFDTNLAAAESVDGLFCSANVNAANIKLQTSSTLKSANYVYQSCAGLNSVDLSA